MATVTIELTTDYANESMSEENRRKILSQYIYGLEQIHMTHPHIDLFVHASDLEEHDPNG